MCDARLFGPQIAAFSSERPLFLGSIHRADNVEDLAAAILVDAPPTFALCGLSMGGIVAMEVLRQAPERVKKIAMLDTNPFPETAEVKSRRYPQMQAVRDGRLAEVMRDEMKPNYIANGPHRQGVLDLCMDMALCLGPHAFLRQSRALMNRPDQSATLRNSDLPTLILCGRNDALCPVSRHKAMAEMITDSHFEIVENAGHLPTLEQPDSTNAALRRWLHSK